jgi:ABC-type branched-subunit amino acid transport system substrate-binding protein
MRRVVTPRSVIRARYLVLAAGAALGVAACGGNGTAMQSTGASGYGSAPQSAAGGNAQAPQAQQPSAPQAQQPNAPQAQAPVAAPQQNVSGAGSAPAGSGRQAAAPGAAPKNIVPVPGAPGAPGKLGATDVGVTADTIYLGRIDFTSATRNLGPVLAEVTTNTDAAAVQYINAHGGVAGRHLAMIHCDDGGDQTRAIACYNKLKDQVFAFVPSETWMTEIVHSQLARDHIPMLSWSWFRSEWTDPYMFPCHANGEREAIDAAQWLVKYGDGKGRKPKTVGINYLNISEDIAAKDAAQKIFEQNGIKVVQTIPQEWDSPDESQHVLSMRVANPDLVAIFGYPSPTAKFFHDANASNWAPPMGYLGNHLTVDPGYGPIFGQYIKDKLIAVTSFVYPPDPTPSNQIWEQLTNQYTGKDLEGLHFRYAMGHHITQASLDCVFVVAEAAKLVGPNLTRTAFIDALENNQFDSGGGPIFRWPHGNHNMSPYPFNREYIYAWVAATDGGYDEKRVLPDPIIDANSEPCKSPKVEDCRTMKMPGTILHGADLYYHDQPYYH